MDFFDLSKPCKIIKLKGGTTNGYIKVEDDGHRMMRRNIESGKGYAKPYVMKEKLDLLEFNEKEIDETEEPQEERRGAVNDLTSVGTFPDIHKIDEESSERIYAQYLKKPLTDDQNLVISQYKSKILPMIEANEVTIISGPTGCGKTTKVPQYILDSYAENNQYCNIIVSQPRRIAAITIAKRVCEERDWPFPSICGYQVGLQTKTTKDTRLTYVTIGVLLQILLARKNMNYYTHVILDEVHERDQDTDFALLVVKQFLHWNSRNVKVVLMSATADTSKFAAYFERPLFSKFEPAPIITIKKSNEFVVNIHYLEELAGTASLPEVSITDPRITDIHIMAGINLIKRFEMLDGVQEEKKSVLVFLPGIYEIEQFYEKMQDPQIFMCGNSEYKWHCVPLHSSITVEEQVQAFLPPPKGYRKIILATNIAESSITVPDVMFVIDYCLTRVLVTDPETNFTCLQLTWASKDNLIQRAGRTGRVMNGSVYRMIYKDIYNELDDHCLPGMLRCPLERVVLQAKKLDIGSPKAVLALAVDPPDLRDITRTVLILKEAGALLLTKNGSHNDNDGDMTSLGHLMASLPVDIHISKLIALGYVFNCLEECIIMGASMSLKSVFSSPFRAQLQSYNAKLDWADGSCSDCIAFLNVYQVWKEHHRTGYFKRSVSRGELHWAKRHFIQLRTLKEVDILVEDIKARLKSMNFEPPAEGFGIMWNEIEKSLILKFVIAGAFYPNYFTRGARAGQVNEKEAVRILCGRDPYSTVYFSNYPLDQPPDLYSHIIFEKMRVCRANMNITYDHSKVFIEFQSDDNLKDNDEIPYKCKVPGKVPMAVYRAVKMREALRNFEIRVLPAEEAQKVHEGLINRRMKGEYESADAYNSETNEMFRCRLPGVDVKFIDVVVTHMESPSEFWAAQNDAIAKNNERILFRWLNSPQADIERLTVTPKVGDLLIAPYETENEICLYRARVESVQRNVIKVFFIDYGNSRTCTINELRKYGSKLWEVVSKIPGQAFKCVLTKLRPSPIRNPNGEWCPEAKRRFAYLINTDYLKGSVYSVVHGVVSMVLYRNAEERGRTTLIEINQKLINEGYAELEEENYLSQMNSQVRKNQTLNEKGIEAYNSIQAEGAWKKPTAYKSPPVESGKIKVNLRGPYSPLEMNIHSNTQGGTSKLIKISHTSVNSVLIDSNPQDPHERLIVAGHIGQNQNGTTLILHNTTIMPNIHGLYSLISLIFAPNVEFRVNERKTSYTGVLCGLGVDEERMSLFPEHDMEVVFDCEFSFEDIVTVNKLRLAMGSILGEAFGKTSYPDLIAYQEQLRNAFVALVHKLRRSKELEFPRREFEWTEENDLFNKTDLDLHRVNRVAIFPVLRAIQIRNKEVEKRKMFDHLEHLRKIVSLRTTYDVLRCDLCGVTLENVNFLSLHLKSTVHCTREEKLRAS